MSKTPIKHHQSPQQSIDINHKVYINLLSIEEVEEKRNIIDNLIKHKIKIFTIKTTARTKSRAIGISWEVKRKVQDF